LGSLELEGNLFLSPLAGYTNLPFRRAIRALGGLALCTTDLVNARSLLERNPKALKLIETAPDDRPLAVQLFGAKPGEMRDAAQQVEAAGIEAVDVNMGCPVRKVCQVGGGSAMMTRLTEASALVAGMVQAVKVPVTVKMRLGWDDRELTAPALARALEDVGVAAVFVHGRTRAQGFRGPVNLAGIRAVVQAVRRMPIIGNGDVTTPQGARRMIEETGCAGVSIGRGAFYNPWVFAQTGRFLRTGEVPPEPGFDERIRFMTHHLDRMIEVFGEAPACRMFRKVGPWYARRFGPAAEFRRRLARLGTRSEFDEIVSVYRQWRSAFTDERGDLLPRFHPPPLDQTVLDGSQATSQDEISVPHGEVEFW
jgi:nifR3 family TIM-barrel protein